MTQILYFDDKTQYYQNGQLHREDGPAIEWNNGSKGWYLYGKFHRENGPAYESWSGHKEWFLNGQHHRVGGPAVEWNNGYKRWEQNDKLHREDGPAIEWPDGSKNWYLNGKCHRLDDPALIAPRRNVEWWLNNVYYSESRYMIIRSIDIILAMAPLQLPAYVVLWILEWINPETIKLNQPRLVQVIQNFREYYHKHILKN